MLCFSIYLLLSLLRAALLKAGEDISKPHPWNSSILASIKGDWWGSLPLGTSQSQEDRLQMHFVLLLLSPSRSPGGNCEDGHDGEDAILTVIFSENKKEPLHPFPVLFSLCEGTSGNWCCRCSWLCSCRRCSLIRLCNAVLSSLPPFTPSIQR